MFASGPISAGFAGAIDKVLTMGVGAIGRTVLLNELQRIDAGTYSGFGTNKTTVEIVDTDHVLTEVVAVRRADEVNRNVYSSIAYETGVIPIAGRFRLLQYPIDAKGAMLPDERVVATERDRVILLAKTSDSRHLYQLVPDTDTCVVLTSTWKADPDDYYVTYDRHSLEMIEAVSTSSRESRIQFWLTFHRAIREHLPEEVLAKMQREAETAKLRQFIAALRQPEAVHA